MNNKPKLQSITVTGKIWSKPVHIPFDKKVIVLHGGTATGKTTLLWTIYAALQNKHFMKSIDKVEIQYGNELIEYKGNSSPYKRHILTGLGSVELIDDEREQTKTINVSEIQGDLIDYTQEKYVDTHVDTLNKVLPRYVRNKAFKPISEGSLNYHLVHKDTNKVVPISTGERRALEILRVAYHSNCSVILIDEPEQSLNIEAQRTIIRDVLNAEGVELVVVATNSSVVASAYMNSMLDVEDFI